ncbi:neuroligin-4, X-linked-like [Diorhabda carinulata]|uniref:neuroligin-4, X-linked-like n=1 Tax=Diorhabda carinulata TaxID=1163345 RepID=UPI0025A13258|nr:neuroligin-4, X-linked-like [Diorhabda carinulata]XP_057664861.1 neuroligin-4, X-linked-like [Diorhabda carinulata]XP_057664862.1 neuroligin-4, X-linked-like [Diorhabda carinulata]
MAYITKSLTIVITLMSLCKTVIMSSYEYSYNPYAKEYTKNIYLKQGELRGIIVEPKIDREDSYRVGVYRGIPYAAPPVGDLRFMPTAGAPSWFGVKYADTFGPVCPQKFPDERKMPSFRKEYFLKLKSYLQNQSEDCLYLNIYAPLTEQDPASRKYPVMVYIHGESFEWNSGNPYDGSVLAAYGNVIVVTLNFRLGILGFLKAGTEDTSRSNFGLVDQIAALIWIKDNIVAFGGDSNSVTLFGHGTGAVCASLLMISPMIIMGNDRLFHRAILMGGTALADWALAGNPGEVTYQVAKALNCQIHDDFAECLRRKRLDEIMTAAANTRDYKTRFGPLVDSLVVPNDPKKSMTQYNDIFRRFELLYGVTEIESINLLDPVALSQGLLLKERDQELRTYFRSRCEIKPELCLQRTLDEYGANDISQTYKANDPVYGYRAHEPDQASQARDTLLDILSDARSVAPLVQMARYHATVNMQSYFYVFKHKTHSREYIRDKTYNGEELPYVFGVPLDGPKFHFVDSYTEQERLFSEIVMMYFSNFAETGNPNVPRREHFSSLSPAYWTQFDVEWPEFDTKDERFLELEIPPQPQMHYKKQKMKYWNDIFPTITENLTFHLHPISHPTTKPIYGVYGTPSVPRRTPPPWLYDHLPNKYENFNKPYKKPNENYGVVITRGNDRPDNIVETTYGKIIEAPSKELKQSSTMNILSVAGGLFLVANLILFVILYFKCYKKKNQPSKDDDISQPTDNEKKEKDNEAFVLDGCNIVRMIGKSSKGDDTYEAVRPESSPNYELTRQMSGSTIDAHTKVREWITQEIIQKYSPKIFRRNRHGVNSRTTPVEFKITTESKKSVIQPSTVPPEVIPKTSTIRRPKPPKVSVEVDATPSGRGPSVLMQQPIELLKSLDYSHLKFENETPLRRSLTLEDFSLRPMENIKGLTRSTSTISVKTADIEPTIIKIQHKHSASDPVQDLEYTTKRKLKTFDSNADINVTSRDDHNIVAAPLSPEESLNIIKRRNFPKVLPDHPGRAALITKRRSMPIPYTHPFPEFNKFPPVPPPRTSTLTKQSSAPHPVFISEPTLAEEPEEEPETVCNNLYVGPLIPKSKTDINKEKPVTEKDCKTSLIEPVYASITPKTKTVPNVKRLDPKVIIKPTINRKPSDDKPTKHVPRVVVPDNQPYMQSHITETKTENKSEQIKNKSEQEKKDTSSEKRSQIPMLVKAPTNRLNPQSLSSDSTPTSEESDTGTVVKKI